FSRDWSSDVCSSDLAKPAPRPGTCNGCGARFNKGDDITYVRTRPRRYHTATCVPQHVGKPDAAAVPRPSNPIEAAHAAMLALEDALVMKAKTGGITPEIERAFEKYQKLKAMALRPGTDQEGKTALRLSMVELIKMVF